MSQNALPQSRQNLVVKQLDNELLLYCEQQRKAYCLNESSAAIWKMCDGKTTVYHWNGSRSCGPAHHRGCRAVSCQSVRKRGGPRR
jgi:hypothetical protein